MANNKKNQKEGIISWIDDRFPFSSFIKNHLTGYYAPKNFNFWYFFGALALFVFVIQILTGIFLTMHYKPDAMQAFESVEYIMRDVSFGWLIRYMHSTGASLFFVVIYLHMFRALIYGSYKKPRELLWLFGVLIFLLLMAEAFFGYLLPWGQMSYWGAQVIVNLFATIPFIGPDLAEWVRGDYLISDATLNRFFAFHVIALPLALAGLIFLHLVALHEVGSNNPDGIEIKENKDKKTGVPLDGIPFHPYYTVKDLMGLSVFLIIFAAIVFFAPEMKGYFLEANNFIPADPLVTPSHIAPVWYFTPFYSILRAVPPILNSQFPGVAAMGLAVLILFFVPWLDRSKVRSIRYKGPLFKKWIIVFVISFFVLGYLGTVPSNIWGQFSNILPLIGGADIATIVARIFTISYFAFFFLMPYYSKRDKSKPVPKRVRMP